MANLKCSGIVFLFCCVLIVHGQGVDDEGSAEGSGDFPCKEQCKGNRKCDEVTGECICKDGFFEHRTGTKNCIPNSQLLTYHQRTRIIGSTTDDPFVWVPELADPFSPESRKYDKRFCDAVDLSYSESVLDDNYVGCDVVSKTKGSVIVDFLVHFTTAYDNATVSNLTVLPLEYNSTVVASVIRVRTLSDMCKNIGNTGGNSSCYTFKTLIVDDSQKNIQANTDFDECQYPRIHGCDTNALCTDTYLSHTCTCLAGFEGDGHTCTAVVREFRRTSKVPVCLERVNYILISVSSVLLASLIIILCACLITKKKADDMMSFNKFTLF